MARPARVKIPEPVKRLIRQRCGFGCVVCGLPLYEYDHLDGPTIVNDSDRITLLCDRHHKERTNGLLPTADVEAANLRPYNIQRGSSAPYTLHYSGTRCTVNMGSNVVGADLTENVGMCVLRAGGRCLFGFDYSDEHLLLNLDLRDVDDNQLVLIERNELVYWIDTWDIHLVGTRLTLRRDVGDIVFDATFFPPTHVVIERGDFFAGGERLVSVNGGKMIIPGFALSGSMFWDNGTAVNFASPPVLPATHASKVGRNEPSPPALPATHASKVGRNEPCPCGSGKKFKRCCAA